MDLFDGFSSRSLRLKLFRERFKGSDLVICSFKILVDYRSVSFFSIGVNMVGGAAVLISSFCLLLLSCFVVEVFP